MSRLLTAYSAQRQTRWGMKFAIVVCMFLLSGRACYSFTSPLLNHQLLRMSAASPPKRQKRTIVSSHFHCYLLNSLDPKHPVKTYVGFTVSVLILDNVVQETYPHVSMPFDTC